MSYQIFKCINCNKLNLSKIGQKSKICAFCGRRNNLNKIRFIAKASTSRDARIIIARLKSK